MWLALFEERPDLAWGALVMGLLGGLALFLFGMDLMARSLKLVAGERMKGVLGGLTKNRFMGVFSGALVTAAIQSSSVTTVLVVGFVSAGLMSLAQTVGVIMGANMGTTVTAAIAAFGRPRIAMRTTGGHVMFKVIGVLLWLPFIGELAELAQQVEWASGGGLPREIANAHMIFNVLNTLVLIWFAPLFVLAVEKLLPDPAQLAMRRVCTPSIWTTT